MEALIFFYHKEVLLVNVEAGCITHWLSYTTEKAGIAASVRVNSLFIGNLLIGSLLEIRASVRVDGANLGGVGEEGRFFIDMVPYWVMYIVPTLVYILRPMLTITLAYVTDNQTTAHRIAGDLSSHVNFFHVSVGKANEGPVCLYTFALITTTNFKTK